MTTPLPDADHSLLSGSRPGVSVGLAASVAPGADSTPRWKGELGDKRKEPIVKPVVVRAHDTELAIKQSWWVHERVPAWLVSTILHATVLVLLVLIQFENDIFSPRLMTANFSERNSAIAELVEVPDQQNDVMIVPERAADSPSPASQLPHTSSVVQIGSPLTMFETGLETSSTDAPNLASVLSSSGADSSAYGRLPTGGLYGRDRQSRASLGEKYGATSQSEGAVEAALSWLAAHQQPNGSWSFDLTRAPCNGRCGNTHDASLFPKPATAATGLALLAFLGAGYTQHEGKYADHVRRGLYFLREEARPTNSGLDLQGGSMYGHGIATMAIGEAMGMARYQGKQDADLFSLANGGASFTMSAQHERGGWRYVPGSPGDMTVTAWQVLSLISAQHGGVALQTTTLSRAEVFVRGLSKSDAYAFGYQSTKPEPTTTAVGLCLLLYLGQSPRHSQFASALDRLVKKGPKENDVYHNYYATLVLHHARHRDWTNWHVPLRDHLVATQATKGHEAGSWHFADRHGDVGGRLYTTAMAAMILEVYYRYLPLYQTDDEFKLD